MHIPSNQEINIFSHISFFMRRIQLFVNHASFSVGQAFEEIVDSGKYLYLLFCRGCKEDQYSSRICPVCGKLKPAAGQLISA